MAEERSCNNCGIDLICQECDMGYSNWTPIAQEKKTIGKKVIFESEEECRKFLQTCYPLDIIEFEFYDKYIEKAQLHGYIRKSKIEEAEEEYRAYKEGKNCFVAEIVIDKMYLAIQELKSENERLKK